MALCRKFKKLIFFLENIRRHSYIRDIPCEERNESRLEFHVLLTIESDAPKYKPKLILMNQNIINV